MNGKDTEKELLATLLEDRERLLLETLHDNDITPRKITALTRGIDPDTENVNYMLMLSILGYRNNFEDFPELLTNRIRGLHRYYQVKNAMGLHWFGDIVKTLDENGIPVLFFKGIAMKHFYAPGEPRMMSDYDIAVKPQDFEKAARILTDKGNIRKDETQWSVTLVGQTGKNIFELDLHKNVYKLHAGADEKIWERALTMDFEGTKVYVMGPEDMFIHQLDNQAKNVFYGEFSGRRIKWLYDTMILADRGLDRDMLVSCAKSAGVENSVTLMLRLFNSVFPSFGFTEIEKALESGDYYRWLEKAEKYAGIHKEFLEGNFKERKMDLKHFTMSLRRYRAEYEYMAFELKRLDPSFGFMKYLRLATGINSIADLRARH